MDRSAQPVNVEITKASLKIPQPPIYGPISNIFGDDPSPTENSEPQKPRPVKNHFQSTVFSTDPPPPTSPSRSRRADDTQQRLFGEVKVTVAQKPVLIKGPIDNWSEAPEKRLSIGRKGFNPITGQAYDEGNDTSSIQPSPGREDSIFFQSNVIPGSTIRTRQPPGGVSSKLW